MLYTILLVVQVISAIAVVALILVQQGKGADAGASFGGGGGGSASQTFFGSSGSGNFLTRSTAFLVTVFFVASLGLAYYAKNRSDGNIDFNLPDAEAVDTLPSIEDMPAASGLDGLAPTVESSAGKVVETVSEKGSAEINSPKDDLSDAEMPSAKEADDRVIEEISGGRVTEGSVPVIDSPPVDE